MSKELTKRQKQTYDFIVSHIMNEYRPPTIREICTEMDIKSTNGVYDHIKALKKKGWLEKGKHLKPKSVILIPKVKENVVYVQQQITKEEIVEVVLPKVLVSTIVDLDIKCFTKAQKMCVLLSELQNSDRLCKLDLIKRYSLDDRTIRRWLFDLTELGINIKKIKCDKTNKIYYQITDKNCPLCI